MSFVMSNVSSESGDKFIESLQNDFKSLASEAKKKYPQIKESCEEAVSKLNNVNQQISPYYIVNQILYPLVQGCETKDIKIIKFCLGMIQRLVTQQVVDQKGARYITDALWMLMENNIEEVKVLQTITLLLTTNSVVRGETLAKSLVLCFRLHFTKDSTIINTAGATIRQLVSLVFERVAVETGTTLNENEQSSYFGSQLTAISKSDHQSCATDAFYLFQDLVQLVNADQPYWLTGMTEMTRTFGLELLEAILTNFHSIFYQNTEFTSLLKERVCALVIKLFSPNVKHRPTSQNGNQAGIPVDKPYFPISTRLLRLVSVLIQNYHSILVTECEIFLSLIIKFLDNDKPVWQRALALEVIHKIATKPELIAAFCKFYDLKDHATNIFQDMINALGTFVQNLFATSQLVTTVQAQTAGAISGPSGSGIISQQGFMFRGVWFPLITTFPNGRSKSVYLEMLEKMEPPIIPEGYCISLAYAIVLEMMNSVAYAIQSPMVAEDVELNHQLINSSWCGFLTAIIPLADGATDEMMMDNILKTMQNYIALCGQLGLFTPRDSFITAICRASLPYHYALSVLNIAYQGSTFRRKMPLSAFLIKYSECILIESSDLFENTNESLLQSNSQEVHNQFIGQCNENDFRQQIVAVGTALPTISSPAGAQHGPVMLTSKNLHCMKALLHLAHCHGSILGTSWHIVLATLQHLVWILGLKPSTGGSLQAAPKPTIDTNVGIQTAVMADLPVLSQMLSQLFESSQYLDNTAIHHLIEALCKLSQEAMELAYSNREPSLFAVAKLLETGIVNLPRIEVLWLTLTSHLLEVCQHRHIRMREWGVEAITYLVRAALQFKYDVPLKENVDLQTLLLNPLAELSSVPHGDVRQRQLECVLQILNGAGENLSFGWPSILDIIGAVDEHQGEALIRTAFQCLQLVITDFLQIMPPRCLPLCVNTTAKFGSQTQELNISLTAVGLMWNISDYFNQNQEKLTGVNIDDMLIFPNFPGIFDVSQFDKLWMCLYTKLGDLCVDLRPAVRKSASQTLFSTISAHGNLLSPPTWQAVLWQVLFPLLDKVRSISSSASNEKVDTSGTLLIHHSRNTAQKQWAETQVLTLSGVSRVFNTKRELLRQSPDFLRAWSLLLEFIDNAALCSNNEVSLAAMKSFQEIIYDSENPPTEDFKSYSGEIWNIAWKTWLKIGTESTKSPNKTSDDCPEEVHVPSQAFLTALVQIFPALFHHVRKRFYAEDFEQFCAVLMNAVIIPVHSDVMPYILSSNSDSLLSPLHDCVLECMELLQKEATLTSSSIKNMVPSIFRQLLSFSKFSCIPPINDVELTSFKSPHVLSSNAGVEWITMNYIPFGEKALSVAVKLYQRTATEEVVIKGNVLHEIIKALHLPLSLKYKCLSSSTWKLAISSLISVLQTGLKVARSEPTYFVSIWDDLSDTLDKFLFPASTCTVEDRGLEEIVLDETIDCQLIELLRDEVLPYSNEIPHKFILNTVVLLNKGSIHSTSDANINESDWKLREMFAKICFETLLQFSLLDHPACHNYEKPSEENDFAGRLAVTALLHRFQEVLKRFNDDERQSGKCPLPRYRLSEISFVLKAIATLIISMKKASPNKVNKTAWEQLIALYPYLVDCSTTTSSEVSRSLREALLQYTDLLQAPRSYYNNEKSCQC